jgi:glycosyltransferase involved in cell wall biosynthesis
MNASHSVTIVIPVYNRTALVCRTLDSVAAQSYRPLSLVVVDNNSTDGSLDAVKQWAQMHDNDALEITIVSESAKGAAAARNRGLAEVKTRWTMFFDSDDIMHPDHVERAMARANEVPEAELIGWDVTYITLDGRKRTCPFETDALPYHNIMNGSMSTQRYMAHTELFRRAGGWDTKLSVWDDIELGSRICALHPVVAKVNGTPTVDVMQQGESISGLRYSDSIPSTLRVLRAIMSQHQVWGELKWAIFAGDCAYENSSEARYVLARLLDCTPSMARRILWQLVYMYVAAGGRGTARILAPLFKRCE